jgi:hypothetical protein
VVCRGLFATFISRKNASTEQRPSIRSTQMETLMHTPLVLAAAGYSLMYLLGGGGLFGAVVIFFLAKMLGR